MALVPLPGTGSAQSVIGLLRSIVIMHRLAALDGLALVSDVSRIHFVETRAQEWRSCVNAHAGVHPGWQMGSGGAIEGIERSHRRLARSVCSGSRSVRWRCCGR